MAFTEQGVAMLSSVLRSRRAVQVNIEIMRAFVRLRQIMSEHKDLVRRLDALEERYDEQFKVVFDAIRALMEPPEKQKMKIGLEVKEGKAVSMQKGKDAEERLEINCNKGTKGYLCIITRLLAILIYLIIQTYLSFLKQLIL